MGVIGSRQIETTPTNHTSSPITAPRSVVRNEGPIMYGRRPLPAPVGVAIVGYAGIRAAPCSRQDKQPLVIFDKCLEIFVSHAETNRRPGSLALPGRPDYAGGSNLVCSTAS